MKAAECAQCGRVGYPSPRICPKCRGSEFVERELREGVVVASTVLRVPPPDLEPPVPLAFVEFAGGVRALGQLTEVVEVGSKVVPEWATLREVAGKRYEGFRFRPL